MYNIQEGTHKGPQPKMMGCLDASFPSEIPRPAKFAGISFFVWLTQVAICQICQILELHFREKSGQFGKFSQFKAHSKTWQVLFGEELSSIFNPPSSPEGQLPDRCLSLPAQDGQSSPDEPSSGYAV